MPTCNVYLLQKGLGGIVANDKRFMVKVAKAHQRGQVRTRFNTSTACSILPCFLSFNTSTVDFLPLNRTSVFLCVYYMYRTLLTAMSCYFFLRLFNRIQLALAYRGTVIIACKCQHIFSFG